MANRPLLMQADCPRCRAAAEPLPDPTEPQVEQRRKLGELCLTCGHRLRWVPATRDGVEAWLRETLGLFVRDPRSRMQHTEQASAPGPLPLTKFTVVVRKETIVWASPGWDWPAVGANTWAACDYAASHEGYEVLRLQIPTRDLLAHAVGPRESSEE